MEKTVDIIKSTLKHSVAQTFLVFSGVLVIVSIWSTENNVLVSFFTLFYALITHSLTSLRKHESLGESFVGDDKGQVIWLTVSYALYFLWWSTGVWAMLSNGSTLDLPYISISLANLSLYALLVGLATTGVLFFRFFKNFLSNI